MALPAELLDELEGMPRQLERALRLIPAERLRWTPPTGDGNPAENFSALGHVCHLRDIESDGYHVRIQRMLDETEPSLVSLDGYAIAREKGYDGADVADALAAFRAARADTMRRLRALGDDDLARMGDFAEYGRLSLRALVHYLRSHDQQHLAGLSFLAGKIASDPQR